jgi:hypothetical protein
VRLDPKLHYLAELAARKQRRTLSSFIEWAVEASLERVVLSTPGMGDSLSMEGPVTFADEGAKLWDVDDSDRFAKMALRYPELLAHEEQKRWKLICENGHLWRKRQQNSIGKWTWTISEENLILERLREHWASFVAAGRGESPPSPLPVSADESTRGPITTIG